MFSLVLLKYRRKQEENLNKEWTEQVVLLHT